MAKTIDDQPKPTAKERMDKAVGTVQGSQAWNSIFRPGSQRVRDDILKVTDAWEPSTAGSKLRVRNP